MVPKGVESYTLEELWNMGYTVVTLRPNQTTISSPLVVISEGNHRNISKALSGVINIPEIRDPIEPAPIRKKKHAAQWMNERQRYLRK